MKIVDADLSEGEAEVCLADGETLELRLPENATTGYQWSVKRLSDSVELTDDETLAPESARAGAGGLHRFRFAVRGSPAGRIVLELRRSWEDRAEPEARFELRLAEAGERSPFEDGAHQRRVDDLDDDI